ncbi:MAG: hypothetical protein E7265_01875 [Lachnospiraceae bacterium]|nr:hypothetical protein [Lachnospiraceae bacterium]
MKEKSVLILGGVVQSIAFVRRAKEMGLKVYVADNIPNSPAKKFCDVPLDIDCFNVDELKEIIDKERIDGIIVGCADILLPVYYELCKLTGKYCYLNKKHLEVFNNKKGFKMALQANKLPIIKHFDINNVEYPAIIKPVDNNSAKGISVCYDESTLCKAIDEAMNNSKSRNILIEEYMICDDIVVDYAFIDGEVYVTSISDRYINNENGDTGTIPTALVYPSRYAELYLSTTHNKVCKLFKELDVRNGFMSIQAFVKDNNIYFYDPAFRKNGAEDHILYKYIYDIDQIEMLINYAINGSMIVGQGKPNMQCNFSGRYAANLVILVKTGKIKFINGLKEVEQLKNVINITQCHYEDDEVVRRGTLDQTLARIHIVCSDKLELKSVIKEILNMVEVVDYNGNDMLMNQLDINEIY